MLCHFGESVRLSDVHGCPHHYRRRQFKDCRLSKRQMVLRQPGKVKLSFPQCDQMEPLKEGMQVGSLILGMFVLVYMTKVFLRMFRYLEKE